MVRSNPNRGWSYVCLFENPTVTREIIRCNPSVRYLDYFISDSSNITFDVIINSPNNEWDYYSILRRPSIKNSEKIKLIYFLK
jgi:hypothetical protein